MHDEKKRNSVDACIHIYFSFLRNIRRLWRWFLIREADQEHTACYCTFIEAPTATVLDALVHQEHRLVTKPTLDRR